MREAQATHLARSAYRQDCVFRALADKPPTGRLDTHLSSLSCITPVVQNSSLPGPHITGRPPQHLERARFLPSTATSGWL